MRPWGWLAIGGVCGTLSRYALGGAVYRWLGAGFPYGTLVVNVTGCLLIGLLGGLVDRQWLGPDARLLLMVGTLGAYTTFSSLIYESWRLIEGGQTGLAAINLLGSLVLGLLACWAGMLLASRG